MAGLRHCIGLLDVLEGLHVAAAPGLAAVHPSQEWLAGELGCAVSTVRAQLDALEAAGIIGRAVSRATPTGEGGRWKRRTNRYWLTLGRIWGRIRAGHTYRRRAGAMSSLRDAQSPGVALEAPPPPPIAAPQPSEASWEPPSADERARVKALVTAAKAKLRHTLPSCSSRAPTDTAARLEGPLQPPSPAVPVPALSGDQRPLPSRLESRQGKGRAD